MKHASLPHHHYVKVPNSLLGPKMPSGSTNAILHGIYGHPGQLVLTHLLLETGAHWSGIPLILLNDGDETSGLQPWGCMGEAITTSYLPFLDGQPAIPRKINVEGRHTGILIDWSDGYSRYPQEHKPLSLIKLIDNRFCLLPNNYFVLNDKHFVTSESKNEMSLYKRGEVVYFESDSD
jgi:hypothetical protein